MIRALLVGLAASAILIGAASAQTFTHTHGSDPHSHSHDISPIHVSGDCCCASRVEYIPVKPHAKRTVTRTHVYTHPTVTRHVYTRTVPATIIRSSHHRHRVHKSHHHHSHSQSSHHGSKRVVVKQKHHAPATSGHVKRHDERIIVRHTDRSEPYAHYDRHWKHRN